MPNYNRSSVKRNENKQYEYFFDKRNLKFINHYETKLLIKNGQISATVYDYTWRQGDKFYKLASSNYGNFRFWWVIALLNNVASEADLKYGQTIVIPTDLSQVLLEVN
jgi:nucleoid-associated protein YgaU